MKKKSRDIDEMKKRVFALRISLRSMLVSLKWIVTCLVIPAIAIVIQAYPDKEYNLIGTVAVWLPAVISLIFAVINARSLWKEYSTRFIPLFYLSYVNACAPTPKMVSSEISKWEVRLCVVIIYFLLVYGYGSVWLFEFLDGFRYSAVFVGGAIITFLVLCATTEKFATRIVQCPCKDWTKGDKAFLVLSPMICVAMTTGPIAIVVHAFFRHFTVGQLVVGILGALVLGLIVMCSSLNSGNRGFDCAAHNARFEAERLANEAMSDAHNIANPKNQLHF